MTFKSALSRRGAVFTAGYFVLWSIAALVTSRGRYHATLPPILIVLAAPLFIASGIEALLTGEGGGTFATRRDENPVSFWVLVGTSLSMGGFLLIWGVRAMLAGSEIHEVGM